MTTYHIVGDIHGHIDQLCALLSALGYARPDPVGDPWSWRAPAGAQLISVGDVVDRGPDSLGCMRIIMRMVETGDARMVIGNHEIRYRDILAGLLGERSGVRGQPASRLVSHLQLLALPDAELQQLADWLDAQPLFLELDDGSVVVHAAWDRRWAHRSRAEQIGAFALGRLGDGRVATSGLGLPASADGLVRVAERAPVPGGLAWAHKARHRVFWGHRILCPGAVVALGETINVESGCCEGHALSAYVHPTGEVVQTTGTGQRSRQQMRPFVGLEGVVFPPSREAVAHTLRLEGLDTADDYTAWLDAQAEDAGIILPAPIVEAHRGLFDRAAELRRR